MSDTIIKSLDKEDMMFYTININLQLLEIFESIDLNENIRNFAKTALIDNWELSKKIQLLNSIMID